MRLLVLGGTVFLGRAVVADALARARRDDLPPRRASGAGGGRGRCAATAPRRPRRARGRRAGTPSSTPPATCHGSSATSARSSAPHRPLPLRLVGVRLRAAAGAARRGLAPRHAGQIRPARTRRGPRRRAQGAVARRGRRGHGRPRGRRPRRPTSAARPDRTLHLLAAPVRARRRMPAFDGRAQVQFIDVRDLAAWIVGACETGVTGPGERHRPRGRGRGGRRLPGRGPPGTRPVWVGRVAWWRTTSASGWSCRCGSRPPPREASGLMRRRAPSAPSTPGLDVRPLAETVRATLEQAAPVDGVGLAPEREQALLADALTAAAPVRRRAAGTSPRSRDRAGPRPSPPPRTGGPAGARCGRGASACARRRAARRTPAGR